jgi:CBS domain-containing protein
VIVLVESWMTRDPVSVGPGARIAAATAALADRGIHRLLVIDQGSLVGIVTRTDLQKSAPGDLVHSVMTRAPATVAPATPLEVAAKLMVDRKIGALPVIDGHGHPVGILTESDTMRALIASIAVTGPGIRLAFRAPEAAPIVQFVVDAARRHCMEVLAILVIGAGDERRVLARLLGSHGDALIDEAWRSGHAVMSALRL